MVCVISMYARRQRVGEFPSVWLLPFCLCLRTSVTPEYPLGEWYGTVIVPNQLSKRCSPYRLFLVLSKGLKRLCFLFSLFGKIMIGVKRHEWIDAIDARIWWYWIFQHRKQYKWFVIWSLQSKLPCSPYCDQNLLLMCSKRFSRPLARTSA